MKVKLTLPSDISEITLGQYQKFHKLSLRKDLNEVNFNKRVIAIFTELKYKDIGNIKHSDYSDLLEIITKAINKDVKFKQRFFLGDVEFGLIPNLDKMTTREFTNLSKWGLEVENLHRIMAILFRPIKTVDSFKNYELVGYKGTEQYAEIMKRTPMNLVNGALDFFYRLAKELRISTQRFTNQEIARAVKQRTILKSGDGILQSLN